MLTKFSYYLNESNANDFKVGDKVICYGRQDSINFKGEVGTIIRFNSSSVMVKFPTKFSFHLHGENGCCYNIDYEHLSHADPEKLEKLRKKAEELKLLHKDVDPYGEENWEYESVRDKIRGRRKLGVKRNWDGLTNRMVNYSNKEYTKLLKDREKLKLKYIDIDPYGEENWEFESVNENNKYEKSIKISDIFQKYHSVDFRMNRLMELFLGKIIDIEYWGGILEDKRVDYFYTGNGIAANGREINDDNRIYVKFMDGYTNVSNNDIFHIKKEPKRVFSPLDPYGEEEWENEGIFTKKYREFDTKGFYPIRQYIEEYLDKDFTSVWSPNHEILNVYFPGCEVENLIDDLQNKIGVSGVLHHPTHIIFDGKKSKISRKEKYKVGITTFETYGKNILLRGLDVSNGIDMNFFKNCKFDNFIITLEDLKNALIDYNLTPKQIFSKEDPYGEEEWED